MNAIHRRPVALVFAALLFALAAPSDLIANPAGRTLVVTLDKSAYQSREMTLLEAQVEEAAHSQSNRIGIAGGQDADEIEVAIRDSARDGPFADSVERQFAGMPGYAVSKVAATTLRISYSPQILKTFGRDRLDKDLRRLSELVDSLRTLPPGVEIEADADGAIVRSNDSAFGKKLNKTLGTSFVITPLTKTSWHVSWSKDFLAELGPAMRLEAVKSTVPAIRPYLLESSDAQMRRTDDGMEITIPDPELRSAFIENVKHALANDSDFVMTEFPALILRVTLPKPPAVDVAHSGVPGSIQVLPANTFLNAMDELDELANPPVETDVIGNAVSFRARDSAHNADRAAVVRQAFAGRTDLVIATQPDQSLLISLAPGAHLGPGVPSLQPGQLVNSIMARTTRLKLAPLALSELDVENVRVKFASRADADIFRKDIAKPSGISLRMVDEVANGPIPPTPPSPGDKNFRLPGGDDIWVRPEAIVTGDMIADANVGEDKQTQRPEIELRFTDEGRVRFAAATSANVGRRFAIIVDGKAVSAPTIVSPITGGQGVITGHFTTASAKVLVQSILPYKNDLALKIMEDK